MTMCTINSTESQFCWWVHTYLLKCRCHIHRPTKCYVIDFPPSSSTTIPNISTVNCHLVLFWSILSRVVVLVITIPNLPSSEPSFALSNLKSLEKNSRATNQVMYTQKWQICPYKEQKFTPCTHFLNFWAK